LDEIKEKELRAGREAKALVESQKYHKMLKL
jgi:hypothetical protein